MHDGMPYGRNQGQGHSREVDRQSPTGLILCICVVSCPYVIYYPTVMARYSLFVLKVPLNPKQTIKQTDAFGWATERASALEEAGSRDDLTGSSTTYVTITAIILAAIKSRMETLWYRLSRVVVKTGRVKRVLSFAVVSCRWKKTSESLGKMTFSTLTATLPESC